MASSATGGAFIRVAYDSEYDQFVINDTLGREIELTESVYTDSGGVATSGGYIVEEAVTGQPNQANQVHTDSDTTAGVLTEATRVKLTANQDNMAALQIGLNGTQSTAATFNFATDTFAGSALKPTLIHWLKH